MRTPDQIPQTEVVREDGVTVITLHPGELVFCDYCGDDWTERTESGGFLFGSKAVCPTCAPATMKRIKGYGEEHYIKAHCPAGKSYADWVRQDLR